MAAAKARLTLEITETTLAQNEDHVLAILADLRARGVGITVDDFGIGYSSLGRLKRFPVSHLKIDGSFVKNIADDSADRAMVHCMINMAHCLGMKAIAEWVETREHMEILRALGCDYAQGYLISPPLPPGEFEEFLSRSGHLCPPGSPSGVHRSDLPHL